MEAKPVLDTKEEIWDAMLERFKFWMVNVPARLVDSELQLRCRRRPATLSHHRRSDISAIGCRISDSALKERVDISARPRKAWFVRCITRCCCELWVGAADQSRLRVRGRQGSESGKNSEGQTSERRRSMGCQVRAAEEVQAACLTRTSTELTAAASLQVSARQ